MRIKISTIKPYTEYTEEEIKELLKLADSESSYDYIIDKLFFIQDGKKNTKNVLDYSVLTVHQQKTRRKKECSGEYLDIVDYKQRSQQKKAVHNVSY